MRAEIQMWYQDARYDLACARDMLAAQRFNYVVLLARQGAEKALKAAYMLVMGEPAPMTHNLATLGARIAAQMPEAIAANLSFLNPHYTITRYVDAAVGRPQDLYDRVFAEDALRRAEEVVQWIESSFLST